MNDRIKDSGIQGTELPGNPVSSSPFGRRLRLLICLILLLISPMSSADPGAEFRVTIAVIIDDMGNHLESGRNALDLPGPLTYSFLPHTPHAYDLAERANDLGKEVMLHIPMQSHRGNRLGPGGLTLHMTEQEFRETFWSNIDSVPHVAGVNNHMGSLLTRHPGAMGWLMRELRETNLFFVDSRTSLQTVAEWMAWEAQVPSAHRDIFLDHDIDEDAIRRQFRRLVARAEREGTAVGIGHPYPETVGVLAEELPKLKSRGIELVPVSTMTRTYVRSRPWPVYSSHSPKVAKSSKPSP